MNTAAKTLTWITIAWLIAGAAAAQQPASPATAPAPTVKPAQSAQTEAGEPQADTSSPTAAPRPSEARAEGSAPGARAASQRKARAPAGAPAGAPAPKPGEKQASKTDRLDLSTATVTGDREQPKVMYIVPWKRSDIGDLAGRPVNSLVDEALQPVDREVFRREVDYVNALAPDRAKGETHITGSAAGPRPEK